MKHLTLICLLVLLPVSSAWAEPTFEVAFSPNGGATELITKAIGEAHQSIRLVGYGFTSKPIAQALLEAQKRGVDVRVVLDRSNVTARYSGATFLANVGIPVRIDFQHVITHDKFIVVDSELIETGSFNFTAAAEHSNAENVLVIRNAPQLAELYLSNWVTLWNESEPLASRY